jgi:hypothetical protein
MALNKIGNHEKRKATDQNLIWETHAGKTLFS